MSEPMSFSGDFEVLDGEVCKVPRATLDEAPSGGPESINSGSASLAVVGIFAG